MYFIMGLLVAAVATAGLILAIFFWIVGEPERAKVVTFLALAVILSTALSMTATVVRAGDQKLSEGIAIIFTGASFFCAGTQWGTATRDQRITYGAAYAVLAAVMLMGSLWR